jgi:hypothetical protein
MDVGSSTKIRGIMDAQKKRDFDKFRMAQWLLLSVLAYVIATVLADVPSATDAGMWPRVQTVLWKCGHLNLAAYMGYWIDRRAFRMRIDCASDGLEHIRRAIIIGATMLAFGLKL